MTAVEAMGRISQIQSTLKQISEPVAARKAEAAAPAPAANSSKATQPAPATSATDFAAALTEAVQAAAPPVPAPAPAAAVVAAAAPSAANPASPVPAGGVTGAAVAETTKKYVGIPYVWGGNDPASGLDCSSFVQHVYRDLGIELPRVVSDQMTKGTPVASMAEAKPGDLLVSFGGNHVAIYLGNGKAIDAPVPGQTIQVRDAWESHSNLMQIRRIVPEAGV